MSWLIAFVAINAVAAMFASTAIVAQTQGSASSVKFDASWSVQPLAPASFHGGASTNPAGETIGLNERYFTLDGKPWLPVMGEFHYSRVPAAEWEEQILKMKAGGVQIVASYIIWIHHEEVEEQFDWSGSRDLRAFVQLCAKHGMLVYLRLGPWAHGEVRNGGFPDWLLQKTKRVRENDPIYLSSVRTYFGEIAEQVHGLLWKDGGPIIGFQLENEYSKKGPGAGEEHIRELKRIAVADGLDVPLYSVTGWGDAAIPAGEVISVSGGYPDAPWDSSVTELSPSDVYQFHFDRRTSADMGAIDGGSKPSPGAGAHLFPSMTAEMGGGVQDTYHRRPVIEPDDVAAMIPVMLGSGVNLYGTYMFQGGENPEGKLSTLQESQATGYATDVPVKSYDFQAPLGEFGEERPVFRKLKTLNYFLNEFGAQLAPMVVVKPDVVPAGPDDLSVPRLALRTDGISGYLFFNNYVRGSTMPVRRGFQTTIKLADRTLSIPETPMDLPSGAYGIWPLELEMGSIHLRYATAQLFCRAKDPSGSTYFFTAIPGVRSEFVFEDTSGSTIEAPGGTATHRGGITLVESVRPSLEPSILIKGAAGAIIRIVLLSQKEAESAWKIRVGDSEHLLVTSAQVLAEGEKITLESESDPHFQFTVVPPLAGPPQASAPLVAGPTSSSASAFRVAVRTREPRLSVTPLRRAGKIPPVRLSPSLSWRPRGLPLAPEDGDFDRAAKWRITIPTSDWEGVKDLRLRVNYAGDVARLTSRDKLLADNFFNGNPWTVGLNRFRADIADRGLLLEILPRRGDTPIFLEKRYRGAKFTSGQIGRLNHLSLVPEYAVRLNFTQPHQAASDTMRSKVEKQRLRSSRDRPHVTSRTLSR